MNARKFKITNLKYEARFPLYWIVKRNVAKTVQERAFINTKIEQEIKISFICCSIREFKYGQKLTCLKLPHNAPT